MVEAVEREVAALEREGEGAVGCSRCVGTSQIAVVSVYLVEEEQCS
jgi:hypothetical protein